MIIFFIIGCSSQGRQGKYGNKVSVFSEAFAGTSFAYIISNLIEFVVLQEMRIWCKLLISTSRDK
jgi:hypothetical protein